MTNTPRQSRSQARSATDLAEPFAKALALFLQEAGRPKNDEERRVLLEKLRSSEPLNRAGRQHTEELIEENRRLAAEGKLQTLKFSDIPRPKPTLRALVLQKKMTQKELARKTGMDAAMVSRVLSNPDHSKLATIKRIARALGVALGDLNLDAT